MPSKKILCVNIGLFPTHETKVAVFLLIVASTDHNLKLPHDAAANKKRKQPLAPENISCSALNVMSSWQQH